MSVTDADVGMESFEYDPETSTYRAAFDQDETDPSTAVVASLAEVLNRDVLEIESLYDAIDPDALDTAIGHSGRREGDVTVTFRLEDYAVSVYSYGVIAISDAVAEETGPVSDRCRPL